nr:39S ribosomal protein L28, mitochondrial [Pogona vitticeps]
MATVARSEWAGPSADPTLGGVCASESRGSARRQLLRGTGWQAGRQAGRWPWRKVVLSCLSSWCLQLSRRLKKVWKPQLFTRELYSEILDKKLSITVTMRTLAQIDAAYGFDFYILKTPKSELCSKLGMDLKRIMLLRLARRDPALHPDDPVKREAIYDKYKEFVIPEEEAEWVGLSLEEAVEKQRLLEKKDPIPLFKVYVEELVQQLQEQKLSESAEVQKT